MSNKVYVLNGPNINMLGLREPNLYGSENYETLKEKITKKAVRLGYEVEIKQSNHEGKLVGWIQDIYLAEDAKAVIINAAAYTHTSIAILDALKLLHCPVIEVHITNPKERESFRHISYISEVAKEVITGKGLEGYLLALEAI